MKFLKINLKVIIAFILGATLVGGIVYAATSAKEVTYTTNKNAEIKNVEQALNDLYATKKEINALEMNFGTFEMGSRSGITNNDLVKVTDLKNYKKLVIQCGNEGTFGSYVSARVYIDNNLVTTISDILEHQISLNNNNELKINFYSYNGLTNGNVSVRIKAE